MILDDAVAAAMDALPARLSVREMAAAAGVSLWSLQRAFDRLHTTPVAHVQHLCVEGARHDLERATPGDTVFAIARRWGFSSPDGAFRDGYSATYHERPSDTLKRAWAARVSSRTPQAPPNDHVVCLECHAHLRRLRRHLSAVHGLTPEDYRHRWRLPRDYPLVCADLSRRLAAVARTTGLAAFGTQERSRLKRQLVFSATPQGDGESLHPRILVEHAEALVEEALPRRIYENGLARTLGVGLRTLRRAFLDERGMTPHRALRMFRLDMAKRLLDADPALLPRDAASRCGFSHYARFRRDFVLRWAIEPSRLPQGKGSPTRRIVSAGYEPQRWPNTSLTAATQS